MEKYFKKLIKNYFPLVAFPQNITKTSKNPENSVSQELPEAAVSARPSRATSRRQERHENRYEDESYELEDLDPIAILDRIKLLPSDELGVIVELIH